MAKLPSPSPSGSPPETAASRYELLSTERSPHLERARSAARLTIPALLPPGGHSGSSTLYTPFQSIGSRGVNHLSAKLLLALFPPGSSFFRYDLDPLVLTELAEKAEAEGIALEDARGEFDEALSRVERSVVSHMEQKSARATLSEALKHLIVAGNVLLVIMEDGFRLHHLDRFVVKRDEAGNALEIVLKTTLSKVALAPEVRALAEKITPDPNDKDGNASVDVYTRLVREGNRWRIWQEVADTVVPESEGSYPLDKCPYLPLRWTKVDGEDYGRGLVEENIGDLLSLEACSQAIVEYAGISAKTLFFINPSGTTSQKDVSEAPNGAVLEGLASDITVLRVEKLADFQVTHTTASDLAHRLSQVFLLFSSIQRDAERVTAEEIRAMANELEQALGGVYSILAQELQRPMVARLTAMLQRQGKVPPLPDQAVSPQIITGLEGLGRTTDLMKLELLIRGLQESFGPQAVAEYVNPGAYLRRKAAALGIDIEGVIRSEDEVQKERQRTQQQQMAEKLGPAGISAAAGIAKAGMTQPAPGAS